MKKVLVLEDEASIRSFIVINLQRAGYEVVEAECGEEALQKLQENPDTKLCLLDIMLPEMDGFEVLEQMKPVHSRVIGNQDLRFQGHSSNTIFLRKSRGHSTFFAVYNDYSIRTGQIAIDKHGFCRKIANGGEKRPCLELRV